MEVYALIIHHSESIYSKISHVLWSGGVGA